MSVSLLVPVFWLVLALLPMGHGPVRRLFLGLLVGLSALAVVIMFFYAQDASQRARWTSDGQNWWQVPLLTAALLAPGAVVALVRLALARPGGARR
ncbi:hypothetical protein [Streptomyces sp. CB03911]|uniref:hypothetical protein n=1 Tax=Streptomyces sp. CB03911 TaxID=1804758 RepID=UPI00093E7254|nr:hypothetical protein [Streptomyces sp. CB03911]OKI30171.1 hypothetical protein A6A07_23050 [Streptomyces sp. CB03911]